MFAERKAISVFTVFIFIASIMVNTPPVLAQAETVGIVRGTVLLDGDPLAGVEVFLGIHAPDSFEARHTCTASDGSFEFLDVPLDTPIISATGHSVALDCPNAEFLDKEGNALLVQFWQDVNGAVGPETGFPDQFMMDASNPEFILEYNILHWPTTGGVFVDKLVPFSIKLFYAGRPNRAMEVLEGYKKLIEMRRSRGRISDELAHSLELYANHLIALFSDVQDGEFFEIWPTYIDPPDGSVDIVVPAGEGVAIKTGWGACSRILTWGWTRIATVELWMDGNPLVTGRWASRQYWGEIFEEPDHPAAGDCLNGSGSLWISHWTYELGELSPGIYEMEFRYRNAYPFPDGLDVDGDGRYDMYDLDIQVRFNIVVIEVGAISGTVREQLPDGMLGDPIPGLWVDACHVDVTEEEWGSHPLCGGAETDESGYYEIEGLSPGEYRVVIWHPDWFSEFYDNKATYDEADFVPVISGERTEGIDFALQSAGSLSGIVRELLPDGTLGDPIPWVWVDACHESVSLDEWGGSPLCSGGETNEDGYYEITSLLPGNYRVVIWHPDWLPEFYDDKTTFDEADLVLVKPGMMTENINFTLAPAGSLSGLVTDEAMDPIPLIWVDACEYDDMQDPFCMSGETNAAGEYTIQGLPEGDYIVSIWNQGYVSQFFDVADPFGEPDRVGVLAGQDHGGVDFSLVQAGSISGRVTTEYEEPVPYLWVDACEYDVSEDPYCESAETNENGEYTIIALPEGDYIVSIWNQGYVSQFFDVADPFGEPDRVDVLAGQDHGGVDFSLVQSGSISGRVTTEYEEPVPYLWVDACHKSVSLDEWGGSPLCNGGETNEDGYYEITNLLPGAYRVQIWHPDWLPEFYDDKPSYEEADLVLVDPGGMTENINFILSSPGSIAGSVLDINGDPVVGILVEINDFYTHDWVDGAETDDFGNYFVGSLGAGEYRACIWNPNWVWQCFNMVLPGSETLIELEPGEQRDDIHFVLTPGAAISGTVLDTEGQPVSGVLVEVNDFYTHEWVDGAETDENGDYFVPSLAVGDYRVCIWNPNWEEQCYSMADPGSATLITLATGEHLDDIHFELSPAEP